MTGDPDAGREALAEAARLEAARVYGRVCRETHWTAPAVIGDDTLDEIVRRRRILLDMTDGHGYGSMSDEEVPIRGHEASA